MTDQPVVTITRRERRILAEKDSAKVYRKKPSLRDRAKLLEIVVARQIEMEQMYDILAGKCEAVERLLAAHHGAEVVTEEQIEMCITCAPLLRQKDTKEVA